MIFAIAIFKLNIIFESSIFFIIVNITFSGMDALSLVYFFASSKLLSDLLDPTPHSASTPQLCLPGDLNRPLRVYISSQHQPLGASHFPLPSTIVIAEAVQ